MHVSPADVELYQQQVGELRAAGCLCMLMWQNGRAAVFSAPVGNCPLHGHDTATE